MATNFPTCMLRHSIPRNSPADSVSIIKTRIHSSRMRTARLNGHLGGEGWECVPLVQMGGGSASWSGGRGVCLWVFGGGAVCLWVGGCLPLPLPLPLPLYPPSRHLLGRHSPCQIHARIRTHVYRMTDRQV